MNFFENLKNFDSEVADACEKELNRQRGNIELIASENIVSEAVLLAAGGILTNKYAEGYPTKRYYGGCQCVDIVEDIARERAKKLFGCNFANVQPHSGANANLAAFFALVEPGDTVMGMNLQQGGHLSHGSPVNISGKYFNIVPYGVSNDTETIDYDEMRKIAIECKPKLIVVGASAYSRVIDFKRCREIADEVGAYLLADIAHIAGLIAGGQHPSPAGYAHFVTTTTHKTLRGPRGGIIMCDEEFALAIDKAVFPGIQGGPLEHIIAGKAVALKEALAPEFKEYAKQVVKNAKALAQGLLDNGLELVGGMTENHLMILDLRNTGKTGKDMANVLERVGITANKNTVPNDPQSPFVTSGVRIGTAATTTRGMKTPEMKKIARIIADAILERDTIENLRAKSLELCKEFPLYGDM